MFTIKLVNHFDEFEIDTNKMEEHGEEVTKNKNSCTSQHQLTGSTETICKATRCE